MVAYLKISTLWLTLLLGCSAGAMSAESMLADSSGMAGDSMIQTDSTHLVPPQTIEDSILMLHPNVDLDTLKEAQRMLIEFETRYHFNQQQMPAKKSRARVSYFDSLTAYYLSARYDLRQDIERSFFHDAGDYFRSDPSFFVMEPQVTPMRKTVQPYGLAGDRLGLLIRGEPLHPFEHIVEPDGLLDLNDIPTALDYTVAALPGPVGLVFGADPSVATLLTLPKPLDSTNPRSSLVVDKGAYSYSYARGRYARNFADDRHIDMSIAYRKADGLQPGFGDDAYQYSGDFVFPFGGSWEVEADGQLYDRDGDYRVRPFAYGARLSRSRIDRSGRVQLSRYTEGHNAKNTLGYRHLRQGSDLGRNYHANLDQTGHALFFSREWMTGATAFRAELIGDYLEYSNWYEKHSRLSGQASLSLARLSRPWGYAFIARQSHVEDYRFLPTVGAMLQREAEKSFFVLSVSYSERAPSLNELFLPYQVAKLYNGSSNDYADEGNPALKSEKILNGAAEISIGRPENSLTVSLVGGKIWDGIDWTTSLLGAKTYFRPRNGDIDFAGATVTGRVRLGDFLRFKGGGSYHQVDYAEIQKRPYTPDYQAFSGLELHLFWRQKLIDLWAYGELMYVGQYEGYANPDLGDRVVTNVKLSFRLGNFRFHWIVQNSLSNPDATRDFWADPGYSAYYGFTWDFFD